MCIVYRGAQRIIEYAVLPDGTMPAREFYERATEGEQAKLLALFTRMGDHGQISNKEKFKKIEGTDFFEFKAFQQRVMCFFLPGGRVVLTHGFVKKKDKIPESEKARALNIRRTCVNISRV